MEKFTLDDVFTCSEAAEWLKKYGIHVTGQAIRKDAQRGVFNSMEARRSSKVWLITKYGLVRFYNLA